MASWPQNRNPCTVEIRDGVTGKRRGQFSRPYIVQALAFDPSGERLACGDIGGDIVVWDLATSRPVHNFATGADVKSLAFLRHSRGLLANGKNTVQLFNLQSGKQERKVEVAGGNIQKFVTDATQSRLLVGLSNGAVASFSLPNLVPGLRLEKAHEGSVQYLALSPDGFLLASASSDHRVVLRDAKSFEPVLAFPMWAGELRDLTFDSKGRRLAIVGTESDVELWNLDALRDGLTPLGLAWDRPAPAPAP